MQFQMLDWIVRLQGRSKSKFSKAEGFRPPALARRPLMTTIND